MFTGIKEEKIGEKLLVTEVIFSGYTETIFQSSIYI